MYVKECNLFKLINKCGEILIFRYFVYGGFGEKLFLKIYDCILKNK